jgi:transposase
VGCCRSDPSKGPSTLEITTIGLDLAKSVFQLHAVDAEAICEAVRRPTMRFVPAKGAERQAVLVLHRLRELLVRQRTMLINAIRGHCAEFGLVGAQGTSGSRDLVDRIQQADSAVLPDMAKDAMLLLVEQLHALVRHIQALNRRLLVWHRQDQASQ